MTSRTQSDQWFARAQRVFPGGVNSPVRAFKSVGGNPFVVERGEGAYLFDVDGNRYVDYINSWGPLVLGHAHPALIGAVNQQIELGSTFGACNRLETLLAEEIIKLFPSIEMMRFVNSGTEAAMSVLRLARAFTKRSKVIKFEGCYHGHVDALLAKAGSGVLTLSLPDSAGIPESTTANTLLAQFNDPESVKVLLDRYGDDVAAIIVEPVAGNCGLLIPEPGFLESLRDLATKHGALLIFDEVMTGLRVDLRGAQGLYSIKPDLTMLGKVIGGGLPVGAFGGRREIMERLAPQGEVYQAGTLSGNPLAMAAGLATLKQWTLPGTFEKTAESASQLVACILEQAKSRGIDCCGESVGTMFGFFFQKGPVKTFADTAGTDREHYNRFFHAMLEEGVFLPPSPFEACFVSSAHAGAPLNETFVAIERAFQKI